MRVRLGILGTAVVSTVLTAQSGLRADVQRFVGANQKAIVGELVELLSLPNVAADRANIRKNADHLQAMLARRGFAVELLETDGNPLVYGELKAPGASRTLLLYAHYDGQAVDPAAWKQADPFTPVLRDRRMDAGGARAPADSSASPFEPDWRLYARSASDDKAPIVALSPRSMR